MIWHENIPSSSPSQHGARWWWLPPAFLLLAELHWPHFGYSFSSCSSGASFWSSLFLPYLFILLPLPSLSPLLPSPLSFILFLHCLLFFLPFPPFLFLFTFFFLFGTYKVHSMKSIFYIYFWVVVDKIWKIIYKSINMHIERYYQ